MQTIDQFNFAGQRAIVRVDFNVPLDKETFAVTDDTRIRGALPTIKKILGDGGSVILMSHLGRPKNGPEKKFSLRHVIPVLSQHLGGKEILFADDCMGENAKQMAAALKPGQVLLLENLRFYAEEEGGCQETGESLAETVRGTAGQLCRRLCQRRVRYGPPRPRFDGAHRRLLRRRPQDVRIPDQQRAGRHGPRADFGRETFHRHHGRRQGVRQDHDYREPARPGAEPHHRRRHDLYICQGPGWQHRQFAL